MGPQFLHVDYAKRVRERHSANRRVITTEHGTFRSAGWSATDLLAEAARKPGHCPHVEAPEPPVLLHGVAPLEVERIIEEWVQAQHERSKTKATPRGRRYPKNRPVLAAGVISYPDENREGWPAYRDACIAWLKRRYGKRLRCVVEHRDENFPHIHYYLIALEAVMN